jgi:ferredoxin, 2Fe-2S
VAVTFLPEGTRVAVTTGATVLELATRARVPLRTVCGGIGNCTACRVRLITGTWPAGKTDRLRLGALVEQGWRLACQYSPKQAITIERPETSWEAL